MKNNKLIVGIIQILYVCAFSAPVELCVAFECEDCYSIRVLSVDSLEKKQWLLKDSVECECGMWQPPSFEIKNLPGESLSGAGGSCVSIGETGKKMKMPKAPQMKLQQNDVVYSAYVKDAKKIISSKYKQKVDFYWKARFVCQNNHSNDINLMQEIDAILIGECL